MEFQSAQLTGMDEQNCESEKDFDESQRRKKDLEQFFDFHNLLLRENPPPEVVYFWENKISVMLGTYAKASELFSCHGSCGDHHRKLVLEMEGTVGGKPGKSRVNEEEEEVKHIIRDDYHRQCEDSMATLVLRLMKTPKKHEKAGRYFSS